jgi:NADPH2:quinone reductase
MRVIRLTGFGPPDVLVAGEAPDPTPAEGQVVVAVAAVSVTFVETSVRSGRAPWPGPAPTPPYIPGNGVGGTVVALGAGVPAEWLGRRVVTSTGGSGAYAELVAVPEKGLTVVPDGLDIEVATALLADGRTATGLIEAAAPAPGERVLVLAAAGGVGTLLVQLARAAGAAVVGAAGGERKLSKIRDLGAEAVDYTDGGWTAGVVDVVFDGVGGPAGAAALGMLRPGGRFTQFGMAGGGPTAPARDDVTWIGFEVLGRMGARSAELTASALARAAAGELRPVIGQRVPLAEAARAHAAIEARETLGKTLLIP